MKSLNRAIARTVSQIARHAGEGCYVPMIMALENHLDTLLTMERKMLEGGMHEVQCWTPERVAVFNRWENDQPLPKSKDNAPPVPAVKLYGGVRSHPISSYVVGGMGGGAGSQSLPGGGAGEAGVGGAGVVVVGGVGIPQPHANDDAQPAPDVVDMTDPANWQVGDVLVRIAPTFGAEFQQCCEYVVASVSHYNKMVCIYRHDGGTRAYQFDLLRRDKPFQWLRHGEVQS